MSHQASADNYESARPERTPNQNFGATSLQCRFGFLRHRTVAIGIVWPDHGCLVTPTLHHMY